MIARSPHESSDMRGSEKYESPGYRFAHPGYVRCRHPEVRASSASLEAWHHRVLPSFETHRFAMLLRMTECLGLR
jgi:hypothetical protein